MTDENKLELQHDIKVLFDLISITDENFYKEKEERYQDTDISKTINFIDEINEKLIKFDGNLLNFSKS